MAGSYGGRLFGVRCDAISGLGADGIADLLDHFDPDLVYVVREGADVRVVSRLRRATDRPVAFGGGTGTTRTERVGDATVGFATAIDFVGGATTAAASTGSATRTAGSERLPADASYVVCDDLAVTTDAVAMEASLGGLEQAARYQAGSAVETTFLSGALPASYDYVWRATVDGESVRLPVRGLAPLPRSGTPELACLTLDAHGGVAVESVPADRFGLQALTDVGRTTAERLADAGYDDRRAVATASVSELRAVRGVGASTARSIRESAQALADGDVVRRTDAALPAADYDPVFVDIETDGLHPTVIWLVGAYDPARDEYTDFVDTEPSTRDAGRATRAFVEWLAAEYDRPSLVTWNGYRFDFEHLDRFVAHYAPEYADYWQESVFKYDLYDWAVREGNAVLPGRTNRLEDVAAGLGCEREASAAALDGKSLAGAIQRLLRDPGRAGDVDWDAARAYCEADVRELAAVYDAIADAEPGRIRTDTSEATTLGEHDDLGGGLGHADADHADPGGADAGGSSRGQQAAMADTDGGTPQDSNADPAERTERTEQTGLTDF